MSSGYIDLKKHGPKVGCGWQQCGVKGDEASCPFVKGAKQSNAHGPNVVSHFDAELDDAFAASGKCKHEWRQLVVGYPGQGKHRAGFYCIFCLQITEK